jgi:hypothetical protein
VILYFCRGELPWQGLRAKTKKDKYSKIMEKKIATNPDEICKTFPGILLHNLIEEFILYFQYCRGLQFEEKPDYNYIRTLFKIIFDKNKYEYDFQYDWNLLKNLDENQEGASDGRTNRKY